MPLQRLSTFFGTRYHLSLDTGDDEDDEDVESHRPLPVAESSLGGDASNEAYSAGGTAYGDDTEESDGNESPAGEQPLSATELDGEQTLSAGLQANSSVKSTPAPTPKRSTGMLKGTGPRLLPGSSRRSRNSATYNVVALSRKARGYSNSSSKTGRSRLSSPQTLATGSRRRSEPPTYNVRELMKQQARGQPEAAIRTMAKKIGKNTANGPASDYVQIKGLAMKRSLKRQLRDSSDEVGSHDDSTPERPRTKPYTGLAGGLAVKGPDVANSAIQKGDSNPASKSVTKRSWKDDVVSQGSSALWNYIEPWVLDGSDVSASIGITDDKRINNMLVLPMQRTIEWNDSRNPWKINGKIDVVALLLQLTGEESPSPCDRCTSDPEYGQWVGCKVMSSKMASEAWSIYGCANCVYHGKQTYCSLRAWNRARATRHLAPAAPPKEESPDGDAQDFATQSLDQSEASPSEATATRDQTAQTSTTRRPVSSQPVYRDNSGTILQAKPSQRRHGTSLVSPGRNLGTLMMEPWEKAPGRIRSRKAGTMENIAYSKSYLVNGHEIPVCENAAFSVEVIRSGHVYHFTPQRDTTRLCSLAAGKVTVNMDGEDPFTIGSHGMFRISPQSGCFVESEIYEDVTLHITSIKVGDD